MTYYSPYQKNQEYKKNHFFSMFHTNNLQFKYKNVIKIVWNETLCNAVHIGISMLDFCPKVDSGAFSMWTISYEGSSAATA